MTKAEFRKVQNVRSNKTTLMITIPTDFAKALDLSSGDYMKMRLHNFGIVMEKANQ